MRAILVVTYDEDELDAHVRSLYDDNEPVPGDPQPGRKLLTDLVDEAVASFKDNGMAFQPEFPSYGWKAAGLTFEDPVGGFLRTITGAPTLAVGLEMIEAGLSNERAWRERSSARVHMLKAAAILEQEGQLDEAHVILSMVREQQREEGVTE